MFLKFTHSLRSKFLISFIFIGLFPFIILLAYTLFLSETQIVNKTIAVQLSRSNNIAKLINNEFTVLRQEIDFIASLDVMDDLLVDDIDKRVSILLSKKVTDFRFDISWMALNTDADIIASSDKNMLEKKFSFHQALNKKFFIKDGYVYMFSKIYASFESSKKIGYLIVKYNLKNIDTYLIHRKGMHSYIFSQNRTTHIGDFIDLKFDINSKQNSAITQEHVIVYNKLEGILENFYLVYAEDKSIALKFLYDFIKFMLYMAVILLFLVVFIAIKYSKGIVKPIENLTNATKKIIEEQDYSQHIEIVSKDEIATLSSSFNEMLNTTKHALKDLEEENLLRLQRFTQLIEVFNKISVTSEEEYCIVISIREMKKITAHNDLSFSLKENVDGVAIYITDFVKNEKVYFGTIALKYNIFEDFYEKQFYTSIASMIGFQLDRIRLINRTKSASNAKSAFISTMSHELRTPLNSIIGSSQYLLSYEQMSDTQQDSIATIESSAHYLLDMINEILDIAKIEAGVMKVKETLVSIEEVVNECYTMLQPLADDKELAFDLEIKSLKECIITTDRTILQQIVINLLSNAIKFTEDGYVKLSVFTQDEQLKIEVKDSGIGIEKKNLEILFDEFMQVDNMMQKKHKGTGLGLALSKKMANLLGGDVTLQSDGLGKGTRSLFTLNLNQSSH